MKLILKSFAEIAIKGRPVRRQFMRQLGKNIRTVLRDLDPAVKIVGEWDNLELTTTLEDPAQLQELYARLRCTPGVSHFFQVLEYPLGDLDDIALRCKEHYCELLKGRTFSVRCTRVGKHSFSSVDVERYVGSQLRRQCDASGIDLRRPDVEVRCEVRHQRLLIEQQTFSATPQIASRAVAELGMYSPTLKDKLIIQPAAPKVSNRTVSTIDSTESSEAGQ